MALSVRDEEEIYDAAKRTTMNINPLPYLFDYIGERAL